jgi:hypothetical protein
LLNRTRIAQKIIRVEKWDYIILKCFLKARKQLSESKENRLCEKIFDSSSDKRILLIIYKELNKLNTNRINNQINGQMNNFKKKTEMTRKCKKKYFTY